MRGFDARIAALLLVAGAVALLPNFGVSQASNSSGPAALTAPVSGSKLSSTAATTFAWTAGSGVSGYVLRLGSTGAGSNNFYDSGFTSSLGASAGPFPANGMTVYATLYSLISGSWQQANYTFLESGTMTPAALTAPVVGSTLSGTASTTFTWTAGNGVTAYVLRVGATGSGSDNLYDSGVTKSLSATTGPLPANGVPVYATLYSLINGAWQQANYAFVESGTLTPATLTLPAPGSTLPGAAATTFSWTAGTGATSYVLWLGTTGLGSSNLYNSGSTSSLSATAGPLPTNGATIYATLYSLINGNWQSKQYTYTESQANWFVDSVAGSDANSGQDINHPYQTIGRLLASSIASGQTIALKAGSQWRETLVVPAPNVTVTSYGEGEMPLLDASNAVTPTLWSETPGTANVYQATVPINADPSITWVNAWENGAFLVRATSIANCDATPGSYYPSADTGNGTIPITLYIHTSDGSNPAANGRLYEYSKRQYAFQAVGLNVKVSGLWTRRNLNNNGSFALTGSGSLADEMLISDGGLHNAYISPGVSMTDVTLENQYRGGSDFIMVVMNGNGMPGNTTFTRVHAYSTVSTGKVGSGIGSHSNDGNPFTGTFTCIDCEVDNVGTGFASGDWNNVVLTGPVTSGTATAVAVVGQVSTSITGGNLVALNGRGIENGGPLTLNSNIVIQNTTVTSTGANAILLGGASTTITSSNISTTDGVNGPVYITGGNFVLTGNTVNRGTASTQPFYVVPSGVSGTSDNNTFLSNSTIGTPFWLGSSEYSFLQWQGLGYDVHSTAK